MTSYQAIFRRYEKKYILTSHQYQQLMSAFAEKFTANVYGEYSVHNIYFDTDQDEIIRTSIERPIYKEKMRMRWYGALQEETEAFVELKKKFDGIVYKRRIAMPFSDAVKYLLQDELPPKDSQILHEIQWVRQRYHLHPAAQIFYDRKAFCCKDNDQLRMTFDTNLKASGLLDIGISNENLALLQNNEVAQVALLPANTHLMELKIPNAMPVWMSHVLSELKIFPTSFSKYGTYYKIAKGGNCCA